MKFNTKPRMDKPEKRIPKSQQRNGQVTTAMIRVVIDSKTVVFTSTPEKAIEIKRKFDEKKLREEMPVKKYAAKYDKGKNNKRQRDKADRRRLGSPF